LGFQYSFGAKSRKKALDSGDGPLPGEDFAPIESAGKEMITQQRGIALFIGATFNFLEGPGD
jgi:acyl CoA:acetate/3-ketoacid CoA transferase beta subunit